MEFDELQQIWDTQNNNTMFTIDQKEMQQHIFFKKHQARHITNISEILLMVVNTISGIITLAVVSSQNIALYAMAVWMMGTALYVLISRLRRIRNNHRFDRSVLGQLNYAIDVASYQVRLSHLMRLNILPIGFLSSIAVWEGGKSIWVTIGLVFFFVLTFYAGGWEHGIYKSRKRELEALREKLLNNN